MASMTIQEAITKISQGLIDAIGLIREDRENMAKITTLVAHQNDIISELTKRVTALESRVYGHN